MPPIDPERLIRTLSPLLNQMTGSIKSSHEVDKLYGLMSKFSKKLVSKTIYIQILKATSAEIMDIFMQRGGWDLLCVWANDALTTKNWAILREIAELLLLVPATVQRLKDNQLPKIIKTLSRDCECEGTKTVAREVYEKWMGIAQAKEVPTYVGPDGEVVAFEPNLVAYELHPSSNVSLLPAENQIILEADPHSGTFDLTQYIDASDLSTLDTDFNPDDFNSTLDEHLLDAEPEPTQVEESKPVCLIVRDGKRFILRIQQGNSTAEEVQGIHLPAPAVAANRKPKSPGKPKLTSPGKPPLKAYEAKTKRANAEGDKSKTLTGTGIPNFYPQKAGKSISDKSKPSEKSPTDKKVSKESESKSKRGVAKAAARAAAEAGRKVEEEKAEKLRLKVAEQKRVRDLRKEEIVKKQKEKDDETLKSLNLIAQPISKIPKIPKKSPSFADMIAIPGSNSKEKDAKKVTTTSKLTSQEKKEISKDNSKDPAAKTTEDVATRRSRPKVYVSGKSRALGLLEDMEQTLDKAKSKEKEKEKEKESVVEPDILSSTTIVKKGKRLSTDNLENSTSKKAKVEPAKKETKETKKNRIQESSLFMDALTNASNSRTTRSKRRTSASSVEFKDSAITPPLSDLKSPPFEEQQKPVFNFYRDTLDERNNEEKEEPMVEEYKPMPMKQELEEEENEGSQSDSFVPGEGEGLLKSALVIHRPKNRRRKTVRWVEDEELKKFYFFDLDETERVNVTRIARNFTEMKQIERSEERKVLKRNLRKDNMEEKIAWVTPSRIILTKPIEVTIYSQEALRQEERERAILEVFYFSKTQIPDSAQEVEECHIKNLEEPKYIPYEDIPSITNVAEFIFKAAVFDGTAALSSMGSSMIGSSGVSDPKGGSDLYAKRLAMMQSQQAQAQAQAQAQIPPALDLNHQAQLQYNLWNSLAQMPSAAALAQLPNAATVAAAAAAAASLNTGSPDLWNQMQLAAAAQNFSALNPAMANYGMNLGFQIPPPGYSSTSTGLMPQGGLVQNNNLSGDGIQNRFIGPGGRGQPALGRPDRGGRPNRWDDRGNYDERRRDEFRRDNDRGRDRPNRERNDRERTNNQPKERPRDREFPRSERNRAGAPRTVLCKFFTNGNCRSGVECDYLHPGQNGPIRPARFNNSRFSSPPPIHSRSKSPAGRIDFPAEEKFLLDDDNWDEPQDPKTDDRNSSHTPSSPTEDHGFVSSTVEGPKVIPSDQSPQILSLE